MVNFSSAGALLLATARATSDKVGLTALPPAPKTALANSGTVEQSGTAWASAGSDAPNVAAPQANANFHLESITNSPVKWPRKEKARTHGAPSRIRTWLALALQAGAVPD